MQEAIAIKELHAAIEYVLHYNDKRTVYRVAQHSTSQHSTAQHSNERRKQRCSNDGDYPDDVTYDRRLT